MKTALKLVPPPSAAFRLRDPEMQGIEIRGDRIRIAFWWQGQRCRETLKLDPAQFDLDAVNRVEVFGTDIDDPGEDYCEFRVIDCKEKVMAVRREMGY